MEISIKLHTIVRTSHFIHRVVTGYYLKNVFLSPTAHSVLANSAGPDEMLQNAAFHLGLHGLAKVLV